MLNRLILIIILTITFSSCNSEPCKIDFKTNSKLFEKVVDKIHSLDLETNSREPYFRIVDSYNKSTFPFKSEIFNEIELIECHKDGTIIFQAPNCNTESDFRDVVYFVAYSPLGKSHIERKRNIDELKKVKTNWYIGKHINSLAN